MTRKKMLVGAAVAAGIVFLALPATASAAEPGVKAAIGKPAPGFTLKDAFGKAHSLTDYKGHVVVLEWTNQQCPYVVDHHAKKKTTQKAYAKYAKKGVIWLAIDTTKLRKPEDNRVWAAEHRLAYPILHDPTGDVGRAYGAKTTPHMFVIRKDGTLAYAGAIDDRRDHNYVTAALDAVLAGKSPPKSETKPYGCSVKYAKPTAKATGGNDGNGGKDKSACSACPFAGKSKAGSAGCAAKAKAARAGNGGKCAKSKPTGCCGSR